MIIKFFPLRTKITDIHAQLGLEMVNSRTEKLFHKFLLTRLNNELIQEEFSKNLDELPVEPQPKKFLTLFDQMKTFLGIN